MTLILAFFGIPYCLNAQPRQFKLRPLEGFFLDAKVPLKKGVNFFHIHDRRTFIRYFGLISKPDTPNFDMEDVVVMALPPAKKTSTIGFMPTAAKAGNFIEIYCMVGKEQHKVPYIAYPIVVAAIPRYFSVTKINFYDAEKKKLLQTIPVR